MNDVTGEGKLKAEGSRVADEASVKQEYAVEADSVEY